MEAVARETESLEKLTDLTMCLCCKLSNSSPSTAFQTLAEKSAAPLAVIKNHNKKSESKLELELISGLEIESITELETECAAS